MKLHLDSNGQVTAFEGAVEELRETLRLLERDRASRLSEEQNYRAMLQELAQYREKEQRDKASV